MLALKIEDIKMASTIVKNGHLPRCIKKLTQNGRYNCWGFTSFALKLRRKIYWVGSNEMEDILSIHTKPVRKPQAGDIVVYRGFCYGRHNTLLHTAVLIDPKAKIIIHKNGDEPLEMNTVYGTEYTSGRWSSPTVKYRRVKK